MKILRMPRLRDAPGPELRKSSKAEDGRFSGESDLFPRQTDSDFARVGRKANFIDRVEAKVSPPETFSESWRFGFHFSNSR